MTSTLMLYGVIKRRPNWICPWFFTTAPMIIMCTAYAVLWWSGDVFNEQLTMSVTEFIMSLAINGPCFIIVLMYHLRIKGKLTSDKPLHGPPQPEFPPWPQGRPELPSWRREWPEEPPFKLERKLRRRERERSRSPARADPHRRPASRPREQPVQQPRPTEDPGSYRYRSTSTPLPGPQGWSTPQPGPIGWSTPLPGPGPPPQTDWSRVSTQRRSRSRTPPTRRVMSMQQLEESPKKPLRQPSAQPATQPQNYEPPQRAASRSLLRSSSRPTTPGASMRRKSPQRVSFKSRPKVYHRTPESSLSGNDHHRGEIQTVV
ncbi:hypothetical protein AAVH_26148 [Aphelenchoides avenae]|nr:hypothetical protein AAVH_26148 [Aphelenchus avenae]